MRHPFFDLPTPVVLGHRGAAGSAPENTLAAFARGLELGADILESDIHGTKDGVPVLIHDDVVDRISEGAGAVAELDFEALRHLDAGYRFSTDEGRSFPFRGTGLRVPSLAEAFDAFPRARFNLEIKADDDALIRTVIERVRERDREPLTLLAAGEDAIMAKLRAELRRCGAAPAVGACLADILEVIRSAQRGEAPHTDSMALQIPADFGGQPLVTKELVRHAHAHGIQIHVWTINDPREMRALLDCGVDGIVTDHPERMAELTGRRGEG